MEWSREIYLEKRETRAGPARRLIGLEQNSELIVWPLGGWNGTIPENLGIMGGVKKSGSPGSQRPPSIL